MAVKSAIEHSGWFLYVLPIAVPNLQLGKSHAYLRLLATRRGLRDVQRSQLQLWLWFGLYSPVSTCFNAAARFKKSTPFSARFKLSKSRISPMNQCKFEDSIA